MNRFTVRLISSWIKGSRLHLIGLGLLVVSLAALLPAAITFAQTVSFSAATPVGVGTNAQFVAIGDFNGDGKSDLATANYSTNDISVLLGTGTGAFGSATNFAAGTNPVSVAVGDLNGDGKLDLATANYGANNVSVLLGTGTGAFGSATNFAVGTNPHSVAIGDLNGDGKPDLAVVNDTSNTVSVLLGTGTGAFGSATTFAVGSHPYFVVIGDLNGDSKPDLAVAYYTTANTVSVLLGTGTGTFGSATDFAVGGVPHSVVIGDLNSDGKPDLATANIDSDTVSILLGTGPGTFGSATDFAVDPSPFSEGSPHHVAIGDLNGDGRPDLAVANMSAHSISVLLGTGTGAFGPATNFAVGTIPHSVAIGDLNGDGKPDLAVANSLYNVSILLNTTPFSPSGSFGSATDFAVGSNPYSVAIGDLNGDGKPDLAVANLNSNVSILLGTGTGTFGSTTNFAAGQNPYSVAIGDLNGDGTPDLAVVNLGSNNVSVLLGTGTGTFGSAANFTAGTNPRSVAIGDLNGDGKLDLAVANLNINGTVSILLGTGAGTFGSATDFAVGSQPHSVAIGDLNGDGKPDLAVANENGHNVSILLGTGSGAFGSATNFTVGQSPYSVAIGDLNGDGKPDLVVANLLDTNTVSILLGAGTGTFGPAINFAVGRYPYAIAIGDLNRDGKTDLAVTSQDTHIVSILLGTGTGAFGSATDFAVGPDPHSVAIGDLNGDGKPDLAVANGNSHTVSILLNSPPVQSFTLSVSKAGTGSGTVTGTGISCGADCTELYNSGTSVTLTAIPDSGSIFAGWTGGGCSGTGTCEVTMNADTSVIATFNLQTFTLTLSSVGTGSGSTTGAGTYNYNQTATVSATANAGSTFTGWTGTNAAECTAGLVLMDADKICTANFALVPNQPDLIMTNVTPNAATVNQGATLSVTDTVSNQGTASGVFRVGYHLSADNVYGNGDDIVIPSIRVLISLGAGVPDTATTSLSIPSNAPGGTYYFCAMADSVNQVTESDETNNTLCSGATVTLPKADLLMTAVSTPTTVIAPGNTLSLSNSVKNQGGFSAGSFKIGFYLSVNSDGSTQVLSITTTRTLSSLGIGSTSTASTTLSIPSNTSLGTYYLCALADSVNQVPEEEEMNNTLCTGSTIHVTLPDISMADVTPNASTANPGGTLSVSTTVSNGGAASGAFRIGFRLSSTASYDDPGAVVITTTRSVSSLAAGAASTGTTSLSIPGSMPSGDYYVCALADSLDAVAEADEGNNTLCSGSQVNVP